MQTLRSSMSIYTRDKHEFLLDFPKLVHRYIAIKTKKEGVPFKDKLISNADQAGFSPTKP